MFARLLVNNPINTAGIRLYERGLHSAAAFLGDLQAEIHWPLLHPALVADEECKGRRCLKGLKLLRPHNLLLIAISPSVHFLSHLGSPLPSHLLVAGFGRVPCPGHITACLLAAPEEGGARSPDPGTLCCLPQSWEGRSARAGPPQPQQSFPPLPKFPLTQKLLLC